VAIDLTVPRVNIAPRWSRGKLGHFVSEQAFAHFLATYRDGMAQLPPFDESFDVSTGFGTVRAYRFGSSDAPAPVVLLPGRNASTPMWRANLPSLVGRRTVYCLDLLGEAGLSVQTSPLTGSEDQAVWLDEALAGLGLDFVHLMGVSKCCAAACSAGCPAAHRWTRACPRPACCPRRVPISCCAHPCPDDSPTTSCVA
jgi:hypothetical protein